jgi:hypothetical protein
LILNGELRNRATRKRANMRKTIHRSIAPVAVLAMAMLACQAITASESTDSEPPDTQAEVIYQDDFENSNSGWLSQRDADGITDYDQGGYRIKVDLIEWFFWVESGKTFTDVKIDVDVTKIGGPDANEMGIICRYVDANNFYFFTITSDGFYGITKLINDEYELIDMTELEFSNAINQGAATNHLQAICDGETLRFYVNGTLLADVQDASFSSGDIGMIAGTTDMPGADLLFDNLVVYRP